MGTRFDGHDDAVAGFAILSISVHQAARTLTICLTSTVPSEQPRRQASRSVRRARLTEPTQTTCLSEENSRPEPNIRRHHRLWANSTTGIDRQRRMKTPPGSSRNPEVPEPPARRCARASATTGTTGRTVLGSSTIPIEGHCAARPHAGSCRNCLTCETLSPVLRDDPGPYACPQVRAPERWAGEATSG
jgi:hypothetical protein